MQSSHSSCHIRATPVVVCNNANDLDALVRKVESSRVVARRSGRASTGGSQRKGSVAMTTCRGATSWRSVANMASYAICSEFDFGD
jgi:hypothetical protein